MKTQKIVLYERQQHIYSFLKYELKKPFLIDSYKDFKSFEKVLRNYVLIIFVVHREEEIVNLLSVCKKGIPVIVCSSSEKLLLKMMNIDEILLLDTSEIKSVIIGKIRLYLNSINRS
ncbi:MAG: hypothetical protein K2Y30_15615 [Flavobacteriaceae bacterium]|nr:hypothetical protein [Flavobacteriaceae bacterium]